MNRKPDRKYFSILLLFLFLVTKGLSYHPLSHISDEDQLKCELCEAVILSESVDADFCTTYEIPPVHVDFEHWTADLDENLPAQSYSSKHLCRPPPQLA